ncbi:hypothetical protein [Wolbachia endosymbiont (group A) of Clivina fossor]|uniref:hypothetical protein n=1 Tax=Wolbachia endosymbiont (group A) of Clivina fossor TaxID=3066133 RepID=UPI0031329917
MDNNDENIGLIRSLLSGECSDENCDDCMDCHDFIKRFESFLDQCPSFLHSVGKDRFFPAFFFGMFATAFDAGILNNEMVYFRFDNYDGNKKGNLKVAVLTNEAGEQGRRIVKCFTIADRWNSAGSRFSEWERLEVEREFIGQNQQLQGNLIFIEYKVYVWRQNDEEPTKCEELGNRFNGNDIGNRNNRFQIITPHIEQNNLPNLAGLVSNNTDNVEYLTGQVLRYILNIHNRYKNALSFYGKESDYHGFLAGFFMNFRYQHTANIYLELFVGGGYADITFLVRGQERLTDSVPIIIELKAGATRDKYADRALEQAENYVRKCPISSVSIYTSSENAVCVGLNFDLQQQHFMTSVENFLERGFPLVERLFEAVVEGEVEVEENVRDYLLYPSFGVPAVPGARSGSDRIFSYMNGFTFGSAAFARDTVSIGRSRINVTKYLFHYHDDDRMLGPRGRIAQVNVGDRALTMVLRASFTKQERVIVFHLYHMLRHQFPDMELDLSRWPNARVYEVICELNPDRRAEDDLGITVGVRLFQSPHNYLRNRGTFIGQLVPVLSARNVYDISNMVMEDDWQNIDRHNQLFEAISRVLIPLKNAINVNSEARFHSILHGIFYACDNPARVLIEYQVGRGKKLDLLLLRPIEHGRNTHPIGEELKFARNEGEVQQKMNEGEEQSAGYMSQRGYKRVTDGNEIVLSCAVFNNDAELPNTLISLPETLQVYNQLDHSSIRR